jgi:hypothetical protein
MSNGKDSFMRFGDVLLLPGFDFFFNLYLQSTLLHKSAEFVIPQTRVEILAWSPPQSWACPTR